MITPRPKGMATGYKKSCQPVPLRIGGGFGLGGRWGRKDTLEPTRVNQTRYLKKKTPLPEKETKNKDS